MFTIRSAAQRGYTQTDWLQSAHSFSFGHYYDPDHMGFGVLRVINDDVVAGGGGFAPHGHRDMEIITHVISGALEHKDSLGNGSVIRPGDAQRMSAGSGIRHSEYNHSGSEKVRLLQVWIEPNERGSDPGYAQHDFSPARRKGGLTLLASQDGKDGSLSIRQDACMHALDLKADENITLPLQNSRRYWLQIAQGSATLANGMALAEGDGLAVENEDALTLKATTALEALFFDLP